MCCEKFDNPYYYNAHILPSSRQPFLSAVRTVPSPEFQIKYFGKVLGNGISHQMSKTWSITESDGINSSSVQMLILVTSSQNLKGFKMNLMPQKTKIIH